jgi:hypothetical protein
MTSTIDKIKQAILNSNTTLFLQTGYSYSICSEDFKKSFNIIKTDGTFLRGKLNLELDYTIKYRKSDLDPQDINDNAQVVLYYNPTPNSNFQAVLGFNNNPLIIQFFPVVLDKFFFTGNGMVYAAKDENTILQLYLQPSQDAFYRDYVKVDNNLNFNSTHKFMISTITIPLEMKDKDTLGSQIQSIWNYDHLIYNNIEGYVKNNTGDIRYGWFCQTGPYTRKDGVYMDCDDDDTGRYCLGEGGAKENLGPAYRCESHHKTSACTTSNPSCDDGSTQTNYDSDCTAIPNYRRVWCQYSKWGINSDPWQDQFNSVGNSVSAEGINACAEGIGNISALPRDENNNIIVPNKLSYANCKLTYPYDFSPGSGDNVSFPNIVVGAFSPWSKDTGDSQIYYDFCSEHDTINNDARYNSNQNCREWINQDSNKINKLRDMYCTKYPDSDKAECGTFCADDNLLCKQTLLSFCKGSNLELKTCKNFAAQPNVNLDVEITNYCATLENKIANELCGCFMPQEFYNNYFNDFSSALQSGSSKYIFKDKFGNPVDPNNNYSGLPKKPECYYSNCASSKYIPFLQKSNPTVCPDVLQCITIKEINNNGTINTGSIDFGTSTCSITQKDASSLDCELSEWSSCVNGVRTRTIITPPQSGGKPCGNLSEECGTSIISKIFNNKILLLTIILIIVMMVIIIFVKI